MRYALLLMLMIASPALAQSSRPTTRPDSAADVMSQLLKKPDNGTAVQPLPSVKNPPQVDSTSGKGAVAPDAPIINIRREGTWINDQPGRMTRTTDGQLEFSFENDGQAMKDPPVVLLPNLKLMQMENAVQSANRDVKFRITGMVTEYKGRNYVLLEKVVVMSENVQP